MSKIGEWAILGVCVLLTTIDYIIVIFMKK